MQLSLMWPGASAQLLSDDCVVSVLNRTARVRADGTWRIDNVPANFGPVRVRATCVRDGVTYSGQSDFVTLDPNIVNGFSPFALGNAEQIPSTIRITAPGTTLTTLGATRQLTVTATYPDNSTKDVTATTEGTGYTTSNPNTATVSADGLVTARASGTVVISAINDGAIGMLRLQVVLSGADSDGDGIPDDIELANGLNPNNPVDAEEDFDGDGLTNGDELMLHATDIRLADTDGDGISDGDEVSGRLGFVTNPLLADSDGDGIRDRLEIETGSDPNDPRSYNLAGALDAFEVTPATFVLTVNTIIGEASRQLAVTGHLRDGTTIDLTSTTRGTAYSSSDLTIANFGSPDGMVFAGADGSAIITVSNSGFVGTAAVTVRSSTPQTLGFVAIPGYANNVDVSGDYAYVAAGATGLQVVDVSDRRNPRIVAALDTPGNANDVKVIGGLAYVADGVAGLRVISVANPLAPVFVGVVDTPGDAQDVVAGPYALVADGTAGVQIVDVSNPAAPRIVNNVATLGTAKGVDVRGNLAAVATGTRGLITVDVTDPGLPSILATLTYGGDARDVVLHNNFAFVADFSRSFTAIEVTDPRNPVVRRSTPQATGGLLMDVAVSGRFAFGADVFFVNGIPIIDIADPANPTPRAILDFRAFRDDNGNGIAVDSSYVYLAADLGLAENGTTGNSRLYIGQHLALEDTGGIAPIVRITAPTAGTTVVVGQTVNVQVQATDDVEVALVTLLVDGVASGTDSVPPYQFTVPAPLTPGTLTLEAQAVDFGGNVGVAPAVPLNVVADPGTAVVGRVLDEAGDPVEGATAVVFENSTGISSADGRFSIPGVSTIRGNIVVGATATVGEVLLSGSSGPMPPVVGGVTDVGDFIVSEATFIRDYGTRLAGCDDCFVTVTLPFEFTFFGTRYSRVFFDGNGRVTFNFGSGDYTETLGELTAQPMITAFWDDLIDGSGVTGIFYNGSLPGRAVFTWVNLREFGAGGSTTVQTVLFADGRIQMGYSGVTARDALVAVSPGAGSSLQLVDYSAAGPFSSTAGVRVAEQFEVYAPFGSTDPLGSGRVSQPTPENPFDLDGGFVLWRPNADGGFDVRTVLPPAAPTPEAATLSIARTWDEEALSAIRIDTPNPPVHARNLFHLAAVMYDAWAAYDPVAVGYVFREKLTAPDVAAARREAISFAAFRLLRERYAYSYSAARTMIQLESRMRALGYDPGNTSPNLWTPAGVGNTIYQVVSQQFIDDGCRQTSGYQDLPPSEGGYRPVNPPCVTGALGITVVDVNRWQPLAITDAADQNGFPASPIQRFLGSQWIHVTPFALDRAEAGQPWIDLGPHPSLGGPSDAQFREEVVEIIRRASELTPDDEVWMDISPGRFGNNLLGANDGRGHPLNPATGAPYAANLVKRGDFGRVLAEFWADGPDSETPPGHWNKIANSVADQLGTRRRFGETGAELEALEWDVKVYFALNAALHDAACAAWSLKRAYDGGRPITYIRYMGQLGQCTDPNASSYHPRGLPLVPDLIELVTPASAAPGGKHRGLPVGRVAIRSWPGEPADPISEYSGVRWVLAEGWLPYQKANFVTPAFPGYISGHSTFSRAAAEVLTAVTGSPFFPGGIGRHKVEANQGLAFERGPSQDLELQWATYFDAADQAGLSRLWGGIHVSSDDLTGRRTGAEVGRRAWAKALHYFNGTSEVTVPAQIAALEPPEGPAQAVSPTRLGLSAGAGGVDPHPVRSEAFVAGVAVLVEIRAVATGQYELQFNTTPGWYYALQSAATPHEPFVTEPPGFFQATESALALRVASSEPARFYRVFCTPALP
ncbi:MAG: Ig-like domain-containing protein [Verrucomicrobiales bacterium]|nr:Ig-like domain-containing protein [Verrucomicrobiales bacterium]